MHESKGRGQMILMNRSNELLREINAGNYNLAQVTDLAWQALKAANKPPFVFRYGGSLASLEYDENNDPVMRLMNQDSLRHVLARVARWYKINRDGLVNALPPLHVVRDMLVQPDRELPVLARIVEAPVFASNGNLHVTAGYNDASRCF